MRLPDWLEDRVTAVARHPALHPPARTLRRTGTRGMVGVPNGGSQRALLPEPREPIGGGYTRYRHGDIIRRDVTEAPLPALRSRVDSEGREPRSVSPLQQPLLE